MNPDVLATLRALRAYVEEQLMQAMEREVHPDREPAPPLTLADLHCRVLDLLEVTYRDESRRVAEVLDREGVTRAEADEALATLEARIGPDHPEMVRWRTFAALVVEP